VNNQSKGNNGKPGTHPLQSSRYILLLASWRAPTTPQNQLGQLADAAKSHNVPPNTDPWARRYKLKCNRTPCPCVCRSRKLKPGRQGYGWQNEKMGTDARESGYCPCPSAGGTGPQVCLLLLATPLAAGAHSGGPGLPVMPLLRCLRAPHLHAPCPRHLQLDPAASGVPSPPLQQGHAQTHTPLLLPASATLRDRGQQAPRRLSDAAASATVSFRRQQAVRAPRCAPSPSPRSHPPVAPRVCS
jgi:hypothetical protein